MGSLQYLCQASIRERSEVDVYVLVAFGARKERFLAQHIKWKVENEPGRLCILTWVYVPHVQGGNRGEVRRGVILVYSVL